MSERTEAIAKRPVRGARSWWMLAALVLGLAAGTWTALLADGVREQSLRFAGIIGSLWLNALRMTVVPLIVALLVLGIARGAEAMRAGRIAARAMAWFLGVYVCSAIFGALAITALLGLLPLPATAVEALRTGLAALSPDSSSSASPPLTDFFSGLVPSNAIAAAANGDILQLVVFTLLFSLAATRIPTAQRATLLAFFEAVRDTLLVLIGWVLLVAPVGIFALSFALAAGAGGAAIAALLHYILLLSLVGCGVLGAAYAVAVIAGGVGIGRFARAMIAPQSVAISSRSSLASIPAMFAASRLLGVREKVADITYPMIGALFRPTGSAMNIAVAFYVAHWLGLEPSFGQIVTAVAIASIISFGSISVPGEVSFISAIAPIAVALGVPIAPLALLVAVEMIPDIFRTVGNVTMDVAVTSAVDRQTGTALES